MRYPFRVRYFVIGDDGQKYGPADLSTLQAWIAEGRLLPTQQVEEEASGIRSAARAVNGLNFPLPVQPPGGSVGPGAVPTGSVYSQGVTSSSNYVRPNESSSGGDDGKNDVTVAWVCAILGFFCCVLVQIPAIIFANKAIEKGNEGGNVARIVSFIFLGIHLIGIIAYVALVVLAVRHGAGPRTFQVR